MKQCKIIADTPTEIKSGMGYWYNGSIITCNHIISGSETIWVVQKSGRSQLTVESVIREYDIAILKGPKNPDHDQDPSDPDPSVPAPSDPAPANTSNYIRLSDQSVRVDAVQSGSDHIVSCLMPPLPTISCRAIYDVDFYNIGMSGSLLFCDSRPLSMIVKYLEGRIISIPLAVIEMLTKHSHPQLMGIQFHSKVCMIFDEKKKWGHVLTENTSSYKNRRRDFVFKEGDVVVGIGDEEFDTDGKLLMRSLDTRVSLNTYLMFECLTKDTVCVKYYRGDTLFSRQITPICYDSMFQVSLFMNRSIVMNKYVLTELSEEMILELKNHGIETTISKSYNRFSTLGNKLVVVCGFVGCVPKDCMLVTSRSIPVCGRDRNLLVLQKINKKQIKRLADISKQKNATFEFNFV